MEFTYQAYRTLLQALQKNGYRFQNYHEAQNVSRCVVMRHDIDSSLSQAVYMAELEREEGVSATYFVLLRTDLYNVASRNSLKALQKIRELGHEIGLHFDEAAYEGQQSEEQIVQKIIKECGLLSALLETRVSTVSMHRPSAQTLEADLRIPGIVNSYSKIFFRDFKYLSDSRRRWREPVMDIVQSGEYDRLHILTHAFWYHEQEETISESIGNFIRSASQERYSQLKENITDIHEIIGEENI